MAKLTKKQKDAAAKFDAAKSYNLSEASSIVKDTSSTNFDASVVLPALEHPFSKTTFPCINFSIRKFSY